MSIFFFLNFRVDPIIEIIAFGHLMQITLIHDHAKAETPKFPVKKEAPRITICGFVFFRSNTFSFFNFNI